MGEEELENHFVASDDIEIEWNNSIIRNTEAEQSRHSSVIKQAVKSNNKDCDFGYKSVNNLFSKSRFCVHDTFYTPLRTVSQVSF
ncbi:hypothetical protein TNCV_3689011 [Trichonephila clavipes]|nr:hypothetical protein TNCV_3689011 [Trichonephila clavipes]